MADFYDGDGLQIKVIAELQISGQGTRGGCRYFVLQACTPCLEPSHSVLKSAVWRGGQRLAH